MILVSPRFMIFGIKDPDITPQNYYSSIVRKQAPCPPKHDRNLMTDINILHSMIVFLRISRFD